MSILIITLEIHNSVHRFSSRGREIQGTLERNKNRQKIELQARADHLEKGPLELEKVKFCKLTVVLWGFVGAGGGGC